MSATAGEIMAELIPLRDPGMLAANQTRGDGHAVNLSHLRAIAKRLKIRHDLALELWATDDPDARLLATLICRPKTFTGAELDGMVRTIASPKLLDWFIVNIIKPGKLAEPLRLRWMDEDNLVGRAGWSLTTDRVIKAPVGLDLVDLLDRIEAEMKQAPDTKQWNMNHCLAEIGIRNPELRQRAVAIGEKLRVLIDYPASPGCVSPYAPMWIAEMVGRRESA